MKTPVWYGAAKKPSATVTFHGAFPEAISGMCDYLFDNECNLDDQHEEDVTRMATGMMSAEKPMPEVKLRLHYNNQDMQLSKQKPTCVMGRSKECDMPINEKLASRQHVRIELRRDKFFIIDQSTNGTHVRIENGEDAFLRREEMPLNGDGQISLGKGFNEGPSEIVKFVHET